jgi:hypothetical protein
MFILNRLKFLQDLFPSFSEVNQVARYVTVAGSGSGFTVPDPNATLPLSDRHILEIHLPGLVVDAPAVIFYRTSHTGNPSFTVHLNPTRLTSHAFGDVGPNSWHEIIPARVLKPEHNELTLAVSGEGSVTFSDIVILYQSDQLKVKKPIPDPVISPN